MVTVIALYKPMHKQLTNIYITNQSVIDATVAFFLFFTTIFEDDKRHRTAGYGPDRTRPDRTQDGRLRTGRGHLPTLVHQGETSCRTTDSQRTHRD